MEHHADSCMRRRKGRYQKKRGVSLVLGTTGAWTVAFVIIVIVVVLWRLEYTVLNI